VRSGTPRRLPFLLAACVAIASAVLHAAADQTDELSGLREQAAQLRQKLEGIEARIRELEGPDRESLAPRGAAQAQGVRSEAAAGGPVSPLVALKKNWAQVKPGTPEDRVRELLGKPEKVLRIDGALVWYYIYPDIGRGSVFFGANGKVSSAQSPHLGW